MGTYTDRVPYIFGWNDNACEIKNYFACESKNESVIKILKKFSSSDHAISLLNIRFENYQTIYHTIKKKDGIAL